MAEIDFPELWNFKGFEGFYGQALFYFEVAALVGLLVWLFYEFYYKRKIYYVNIIIFAIRAGGVLLGHDKGGFVKRDGQDMFRLMKRKIERMPPPQDCLYMDDKGRTWLFYYKYGHHDFTPTKVSDIPALFEEANHV